MCVYVELLYHRHRLTSCGTSVTPLLWTPPEVPFSRFIHNRTWLDPFVGQAKSTLECDGSKEQETAAAIRDGPDDPEEPRAELRARRAAASAGSISGRGAPAPPASVPCSADRTGRSTRRGPPQASKTNPFTSYHVRDLAAATAVNVRKIKRTSRFQGFGD